MKILIVDDEYLLRRYTREVLSQFGDCDTVVNGKEALSAFEKAHKNNKPYDLITMDIMMPGFTGIETLKSIRQWEKTHSLQPEKQVKVIMITGSQDKHDFLHSFREGCEVYILKPYYPENLVEALNKLGFVLDDA